MTHLKQQAGSIVVRSLGLSQPSSAGTAAGKEGTCSEAVAGSESAAVLGFVSAAVEGLGLVATGFDCHGPEGQLAEASFWETATPSSSDQAYYREDLASLLRFQLRFRCCRRGKFSLGLPRK